MMKHNIPCEVIQDLLPSYIDGLTSAVTNTEIEVHVKECASCRAVLDAMKNPDAEPVDYDGREEIDFLKKTRKKTRRMIAVAALCALLFVALVLLANFFLAGREINSDYLVYELEVSGEHLSIKGNVTSDTGIQKVEISESDGIVQIRFMGTESNFIYDGAFEKEYTSSEQIREIRIGERIVWSHGEAISPMTSAVYQTRHAYVGDMPANGRTAEALNVGGCFGDYINELQTDGEPYGWKLILGNTFSGSRRKAMEERMRSCAYVMLAVIENLGEVTFEYETDGEVCTLTVDADEASAYAGENIKLVGEDVNLLENLMKKAGFLETRSADGETMSFSGAMMKISLVNFADDEIAAIDMTYSAQNEVLGFQGTKNANGYALAQGQIVDFQLIPEDFGDGFSKQSEAQLEFTVYDSAGNAYPAEGSAAVGIESGGSYGFELYGNAADGYRVKTR